MAKQRLSVRKIKEVLRLFFEEGRSHREIGRSLRIGRSTVGEYLTRARETGLKWPLPEDWTDARLEAELFPLCGYRREESALALNVSRLCPAHASDHRLRQRLATKKRHNPEVGIMHDTQLHLGLGVDRFDGVGEALQADHGGNEDVLDAPVGE